MRAENPSDRVHAVNAHACTARFERDSCAFRVRLVRGSSTVHREFRERFEWGLIRVPISANASNIPPATSATPDHERDSSAASMRRTLARLRPRTRSDPSRARRRSIACRARRMQRWFVSTPTGSPPAATSTCAARRASLDSAASAECPGGGNGRRAGLRCLWGNTHAGSIPVRGTTRARAERRASLGATSVHTHARSEHTGSRSTRDGRRRAQARSE